MFGQASELAIFGPLDSGENLMVGPTVVVDIEGQLAWLQGLGS